MLVALVAGLLSPPTPPAVAGADLPADVLAAIRKEYVAPDAETRYLAGRVDLNGDGKDEIVVHVVGMMACGSGGCSTLVFTPAGAGHRLVATIAVSRAPIRVGAERSHGWRSLVVRVGGGGARPHDVALAFDGSSYPSNPTVAGPHVTTTNAADADLVIAEVQSFTDATLLPSEPASPAEETNAPAPAEPNETNVSAPTQPSETNVRVPKRVEASPPPPPAERAQTSVPTRPASGPSFDCAKASVAVEKLVCRDAGLAALDRKLDAVYVEAMREWPPAEQATQRTAQRAWLKTRNGCGDGRDARGCVAAAYRRRLIEVQIQGGRLEAPRPVAYTCAGHARTPFTVAFYRQTEPASAVVTFGDRQAIVLATPAASGARYVGPDVELWEHHGEVTLTWSRTKYVCKAR